MYKIASRSSACPWRVVQRELLAHNSKDWTPVAGEAQRRFLVPGETLFETTNWATYSYRGPGGLPGTFIMVRKVDDVPYLHNIVGGSSTPLDTQEATSTNEEELNEVVWHDAEVSGDDFFAAGGGNRNRYDSVFAAIAERHSIDGLMRRTAQERFTEATGGDFASVTAFNSARTAINTATGAETVAQLARAANANSGPKTYNSSGNANYMNLNHRNGNPIRIRGARRDQHFKAANQIVGNGLGGVSPPNYTWHHLTVFGRMVLVDRGVHAKHGHNGGIYLW